MSSVNEAGIDQEEQVFHTSFSFVDQIIHIFPYIWSPEVKA